jgi:hypothetical protein
LISPSSIKRISSRSCMLRPVMARVSNAALR